MNALRTAKNLWLLLLMIGVSLSAAHTVSAETKIYTAFDKRTLDVNDELHMMIRVVGTVGNPQKPELPVFAGFSTHYVGRSSRFQFVDGKSEHTIEFKYTLIPERVGTFTVGPCVFKIDTVLGRLDPVIIEVISTIGNTVRTVSHTPSQPVVPAEAPFQTTPDMTAGPLTSVSLPSTNAATPAADASAQVTSHITQERLPGDDHIFAVMTVDKASVFINEQVTVTYTIYTDLQSKFEGFQEEPNTKDFWTEELPDAAQLARESVLIQGRNYVKAEVRKIALFAQKEGTYVIAPGTIKASVSMTRTPAAPEDIFNESYFGKQVLQKREARLLEMKPITITVLPFPTLNKPDTFSGLAGEFRMRVDVDQKSVKQNEPVTMRVVIEGKGNIGTLVRPAFLEPEHCLVFDNDAETSIIKQGGMVQGKKQFEILFMPQKVGSVVLPQITFSYFNIPYRSYMTLTHGPFPVTVLPGTEKPGLSQRIIPQELKETVTVEQEDIQYIKSERHLKIRAEERSIFVLMVLNGILWIMNLIVSIIKRREALLDRDVVAKRKRNALKVFHKRAKHLTMHTKAESAPFYEACATAFDAYIADRYNLSAYGLTWPVVEGKLKGSGIEEVIIAECRSFYDQCNVARFTTRGGHTGDHDAVVKTMMKLADTIEKHTK